MIKSGLLLGAANIATALFGLLRNVLVARLISIEDFGIASTFAITMALVEMTSNIALDRLIVQAKDGDTPSLQATVHAIQAVRGVGGAVVLSLIAYPLALFFGVSHVAWAYQSLAVIPLLRGLASVDMFRLQRDMRFLPSIVVESGAQLIATMAAVALALWVRDYRAMLFALIIQQCAYTAISYFVAERPYRWGWDRDIARRAFSFGWPLLLNSILMFGIFQGDRIIVGSQIGMRELGWFSAAFTLTLMPTMVFAKTMGTFFLPQLVTARNDGSEFQRIFLVTVEASFFIGGVLMVAFAIAGPPLLLMLYGNKYADALPVLSWLAVMQALRLAKSGPATAALSVSATTNPLIANIARVAMLPIAWIGVAYGGGISTVVALGIFGECLAFFVSLLLLQRLSVSLHGLSLPLFGSILVLALIGVDAVTKNAEYDLISAGPWLHVVLVGAVPLLLFSMPALRQWTKASLGSFRRAVDSFK